MIQWCLKGLTLPNDDEARRIIDGGQGLLCNWWRAVGTISPQHIRVKLTPGNIDMHVNHFKMADLSTGAPFSESTPFISLSAGTVERDTVARTNQVHRARRTALWFGTQFGRSGTAYLFTCWTVLAPRAAVEIEGISEEVRDLNTYRRYSSYQTEGEVTAKISVPDNQIQMCEKWELNDNSQRFERTWTYSNPRFSSPERLSNVRELI